jgi:hypothetical protein
VLRIKSVSAIQFKCHFDCPRFHCFFSLQDESSPTKERFFYCFLAGAKGTGPYYYFGIWGRNGTIGAELERMSHKQDPQKYSINATTDGKKTFCEAYKPIQLPLERDYSLIRLSVLRAA